jgi:hypothetical protein
MKKHHARRCSNALKNTGTYLAAPRKQSPLLLGCPAKGSRRVKNFPTGVNTGCVAAKGGSGSRSAEDRRA